MKLEAIEGVTVSIRTDNIELAEYEDDADELYIPSIGRKYVQAASGSNFSVHSHIKKNVLTPPDPRDKIDFAVHLDGQFACASVYDIVAHLGHYIKDCDGIHETRAGGTFLKPFTFSELATDDRPANDSKFKALKGLGEIKVMCTWCRTTSPPRPAATASGYKSVVDGSVPEKCLKGRAISQAAGLGAARRVTHARTEVNVEYPYGKTPFASYIFKYRSRHDLQIEGIIPRSPSPVPLEDRDPDSLSAEEARELVRRMREREQDAAKIKREKRARSPTVIHDGEEGDDDDDVTIESEGRRRKRNRASTDSGVDVVDLTDL